MIFNCKTRDGRRSYPGSGGDSKLDCVGGQSAAAANQIATHIDKIKYSTFVDPMAGNAAVYRAIDHRGKEVLNDKDCSRIRVAKINTCSNPQSDNCQAFLKAKKSCGVDYKTLVRRYDQKNVLLYLDPPYADVKSENKKYKYNNIPFEEFSDVVHNIKNASVVISYKNTAPARKEFCEQGYRCHKISKNIFNNKWIELLAVKDP